MWRRLKAQYHQFNIHLILLSFCSCRMILKTCFKLEGFYDKFYCLFFTNDCNGRHHQFIRPSNNATGRGTHHSWKYYPDYNEPALTFTSLLPRGNVSNCALLGIAKVGQWGITNGICSHFLQVFELTFHTISRFNWPTSEIAISAATWRLTPEVESTLDFLIRLCYLVSWDFSPLLNHSKLFKN